MTVFVVESTAKSHLHKLFTFWDTDFFATPYTWVNPLLMAAIGIVAALIFAPVNQFLALILVGIVYGILIMTCSFF